MDMVHRLPHIRTVELHGEKSIYHVFHWLSLEAYPTPAHPQRKELTMESDRSTLHQTEAFMLCLHTTSQAVLALRSENPAKVYQKPKKPLAPSIPRCLIRDQRHSTVKKIPQFSSYKLASGINQPIGSSPVIFPLFVMKLKKVLDHTFFYVCSALSIYCGTWTFVLTILPSPCSALVTMILDSIRVKKFQQTKYLCPLPSLRHTTQADITKVTLMSTSDINIPHTALSRYKHWQLHHI